MSGKPQRRSLVAELKRRKVLRVAYLYVAGAVATAGGAELFFPRVGLPDWTVTFVIALAVVGLPLALALAWAYDVNPADPVRAEEPTSRQTDPETQVPSAPPAGIPDAGHSTGEAQPLPGLALPESEDRRGVAVLPFSNLSPAPDHAYFADGVTEDVLAHLAKVKGL